MKRSRWGSSPCEREREGSVLISTVGYDRLTWRSRPPAPFDFKFHQRERNKFVFLSLIFLTRLNGCEEARGETLHLDFILNNAHIHNSKLIVHVCEFLVCKYLTRAHHNAKLSFWLSISSVMNKTSNFFVICTKWD